MKHEIVGNDGSRVAGTLTIRKFRQGKLAFESTPLPNKVVSGNGGYGRNLLVRALAGDGTYPVKIDTVRLGDDDTTPTDADTDLGNVLVSDIPITNMTAADNVLNVDVFVTDANLPDDTYEEFGLFCAGRLFARIIIDPAYTKEAGDDTLFTYTLELTG